MLTVRRGAALTHQLSAICHGHGQQVPHAAFIGEAFFDPLRFYMPQDSRDLRPGHDSGGYDIGAFDRENRYLPIAYH